MYVQSFLNILYSWQSTVYYFKAKYSHPDCSDHEMGTFEFQSLNVVTFDSNSYLITVTYNTGHSTFSQ